LLPTITGIRIFERLRDEHGYGGGYTVVKDHVRRLRARGREVFVPLSHPPGHAQVDFGEAVAEIGGVRQKVHFFCLDLPQSDACFVKAYPRETTEAFLEGRPQHGRITKQGRTHARTMLVEAAWQAVRGPGPLRAFYQRVSARRGNHIAAVAVARKLVVILWHMLTKGDDYAGVRPALHAKKLRDLELRSGQPERRGQRGSAYEYNLTRTRQEEKRRAEQSEIAYRRLTEGWTRRGRTVPMGAAKEERP
jgi:hypothetical protein